jgi:uncharacterized protein YggT (Ycf19 family)
MSVARSGGYPRYPTYPPEQGYPARPPEQEREEPEPVTTLMKVARVAVWVLYAIVILNAAILVMAFALRLLGANPDADFTQWVYRSADRSMGPFRGIFPEHQISDDSVFDTSLLFAAVMYILAAVAIDSVLHWLKTRLAPRRPRA